MNGEVKKSGVMSCRRRAFTLTELLVVVIVLGILSAVAVPKFTRILETRKTTEAEDVMGAIRTEQEKRCALGKPYTADMSLVATAKGSDASSHYTYSLGSQGVTAASSKGYSLKMLSYKDGRVCCEGSYCQSLNKDYPLCESLSAPADECAGAAETDPCEINPDSCACAGYAAAHPCECSGICDPCQTNPNTCSCAAYASAHPQECDPDSCTNHPNQEKCCGGETPYWNGTECTVKPLDICETHPQSEECCNTKEGYVWADGQCKKKCENEYYNDPCPPGEYSGGYRHRICDENCENCKWDYSQCIERQDCNNSDYFDAHLDACCAQLKAEGETDWRCCSAEQVWDVDLMECITCTPSYKTDRVQAYYLGGGVYKNRDTDEIIEKTCPSTNFTCPADQESRFNTSVCQTFSGMGATTTWEESVSYTCTIKGNSGPTGGSWEKCDCDDVMEEMGHFFGVNTYGNACAGPDYAEVSMNTSFQNSGLRHVDSMDAFHAACSDSGLGGGADSKDGAWYISGRTMYVKACKGGYSWLDVTTADCCPQSYRWEE